MTERFYQPGEDVRHELTSNVRALAERAVAAISPTLRLVNVKEASSMVSCLLTVLQVIVSANLFQPFTVVLNTILPVIREERQKVPYHVSI